MKKTAWKKRIREACKEAGTYETYFEYTIDALAGILEKRDEAAEEYKEDGSGPVISFTNKSGAENKVKNPYLALWDDLNKSALTYWRDLGLTPAGLKKLKEKHFSKEQEAEKVSLIDKLAKLREERNG